MKKNLLWIIVFFGLTACGDFLEPKSETLFIPREVTALDEMLLGVAYPRVEYSMYLNTGIQLLDDDVTCTSLEGAPSIYDEPKINAMRYMFSWQPDMFEKAADGSNYKGVWEKHYNLIMGANAALDYVDGVSGTYDEKTLLKAQAYTLRAYYFFNLVNMFGEPYNDNKKALGIPLKLTSGMENQDIARSTVEETYDRVVKDLNEAERLYLDLPQNLQYRRDLRVSLPMVQLLKSRVFLYMENWKEAAVYARKVIEEWEFSLLDLNTLPLSTPEERTYYPFIAQESPEVIWLYSSTADLAPYYTLGITPTGSFSSRKMLNASPDLLACFKEGDLRKEFYIYRDSPLANDGTFLAYGKNTASTGSALAGDKFARAFRLSEAYLNLAEASAVDGDETTALWALKQLRDKRFTPEAPGREISGITGSDLVDKIREERRVELCYEFHRWFDLRRYGMPSINHSWNSGKGVIEYTLREKDPAYTLPIPEVVMNQNRALVQNKLASPR